MIYFQRLLKLFLKILTAIKYNKNKILPVKHIVKIIFNVLCPSLKLIITSFRKTISGYNMELLYIISIFPLYCQAVMWHYYKQATSSGISKKQAEPRWFSVRCGNSHRAHETNKNKKGET